MQQTKKKKHNTANQPKTKPKTRMRQKNFFKMINRGKFLHSHHWQRGKILSMTCQGLWLALGFGREISTTQPNSTRGRTQSLPPLNKEGSIPIFLLLSQPFRRTGPCSTRSSACSGDVESRSADPIASSLRVVWPSYHAFAWQWVPLSI